MSFLAAPNAMLRRVQMTPPTSRSRVVRVVALAALLLVVIVFFQHSRSALTRVYQNAELDTTVESKVPRVTLPQTANYSRDAKGCYPTDAASRIRVVKARGMTVDVDRFSRLFQNEFPFDHTGANWAAMSGSGVWLESQQVYVTSTRMMFKESDCKAPCQAGKISYVYLQAWDGDFQPTTLHYTRGDDFLVGIPLQGRLSKIYAVTGGERWRGPEDARMNTDRYGNLVLTFNMGDERGRHFYSYNITDNNLLELQTIGENGNWEKNWAPLFIGEDLHFVYSFDPLRILKCSNRGMGCTFVVGKDQQGIADLRGGTPFMRYKDTHYYVGFPRTAHICDCGRVYRPHIAILHAPPLKSDPSQTDYRQTDMIYVSQPLDFERVALRPPHTPPNPPEVCGSYLLSCGFLRWDLTTVNGTTAQHPGDRALIEVSVQDAANVVIEFSGLELIVADVIDAEQERVQALLQQGLPWEPVSKSQVKCSSDQYDAVCPPKRR
ncbi:Beta-mannosyltransferase 1 [Sorochytrium milnesiophthora]